MTYKNIKFDESSIMRSLEKIAVKKGLIKPEEMIKVASTPKEDTSLVPTENFEENILKLCSALRNYGYEKYAEEVESKFFVMKKAQYAVHDETGEDLINSAHPKGSTYLKGLEGEAVFTTVIDKQKALQHMISRKPIGKQASLKAAADMVKLAGKLEKKNAINAVKVILAQTGPKNTGDIDTGLTQPVIDKVMSYFKAIDKEIESLSGYTISTGINNDGVIAYDRLKSNFIKHMSNHTINNTTLATINNITDEAIKAFETREASRLFLINPVAKNIVFFLKELKNYVNDFVIDDHKALISSANSPEVKTNKTSISFFDSTSSIKKQLKGWLPIMRTYKDIADQKEGSDWILSTLKKLDAIESIVQDTPEETINMVSPRLKQQISAIQDEMDEFRSAWIDAPARS